MLKLSRFNWLKALSPIAIAASVCLATEIPANAVPHTPLPSSRHSSGNLYRQRRVVAPPSLNITAPAGRHTPLPRSSRSYYYRSRDRHRSRDRYYSREDCRDGDRGRRRSRQRRRDRYRSHRKGYRGVIIINPGRRY